MDVRGFDELTKAGRAARLRLLATDTLRTEFDIEPRRVSLLAAHSFNTMFRADIADSARVAVRVGEVRIHTDGVEEVEAAWLACHARRDRPGRADVERRLDTAVTLAAGHHPLVPGPSLLLGDELGARPHRAQPIRPLDRSSHGRRAGADSTSTRAPTPHPTCQRDSSPNRVVYFGDTRIAAEVRIRLWLDVRRGDRQGADAPRRSLAMRHHIAPHLLHGDFGPQNVMRHRVVLTPIDFQDLQFGFDLQDVAITVADLRRVFHDESLIDVPHRRIPNRCAMAADDEPLLEQALAAARSLNVINLGLNLRRPGLPEFIDRHSALVAEWMTRFGAAKTTCDLDHDGWLRLRSHLWAPTPESISRSNIGHFI